MINVQLSIEQLQQLANSPRGCAVCKECSTPVNHLGLCWVGKVLKELQPLRVRYEVIQREHAISYLVRSYSRATGANLFDIDLVPAFLSYLVIRLVEEVHVSSCELISAFPYRESAQAFCDLQNADVRRIYGEEANQ